jgi:hypothetical protein
MRRFLRSAALYISAAALVTSAVPRPAGAAGEFVSLAHLAPALGYTYTWVASESAVALTRPGLYILVRTGNPLYDVNETVETTAQTPEFRNNDIYVGTALVARLRALAGRYGSREHFDAAADAVAPAAPIHGALTVAAAPTGVSDVVIVSGSGPANIPLTITLSADISRDLPRVLLSRTTAATDAAGKFSVSIATAPLHLAQSLVLISATSLPGVTEAHTSFVLGAPSPGIAHPVDELPRDFKPH